MKNKTMQEMNEQFKNCPTTQRECVVEGSRFIVISHFVGSKDINSVIQKYAMKRALEDTLGRSVIKSRSAE